MYRFVTDLSLKLRCAHFQGIFGEVLWLRTTQVLTDILTPMQNVKVFVSALVPPGEDEYVFRLGVNIKLDFQGNKTYVEHTFQHAIEHAVQHSTALDVELAHYVITHTSSQACIESSCFVLQTSMDMSTHMHTRKPARTSKQRPTRVC